MEAASPQRSRDRPAANGWCAAGMVCSAKAHSRGYTQAGPAARQARKEAKRERKKMRRTACLSRSERSEGMRFAPQTTLPPAPPRLAQPEAGRPGVFLRQAQGKLTLGRAETDASGPSSCGCPVARPSPRCRCGISCRMRVNGGVSKVTEKRYCGCGRPPPGCGRDGRTRSGGKSPRRRGRSRSREFQPHGPE